VCAKALVFSQFPEALALVSKALNVVQVRASACVRCMRLPQLRLAGWPA
jgi:hypothetical protein